MYKTMISFLTILSLVFTSCSSSDEASNTPYNDSKDNNFTVLRGSVPGTLIEAICDDNKNFATNSEQIGSQHPFALEIETGLSCRLLMTTNEGTADNIITNISFTENNVTGDSFVALAHNINLGYIPLETVKSNIVDDNNDSIVDTPITLPLIQHVDTLDIDNSGSSSELIYEEYNSSKQYVYLDRVTYNSENFEAKEATQGYIPDYNAIGKWIPLSFSSNASTYAEYDNSKNYSYPNRVLYFNVVYQSKYDTVGNTPNDLNTSAWLRLGEY